MTEQNINDPENSQQNKQSSRTFFEYKAGTDYGGANEFITEEFKKVNSLRGHDDENKEIVGLALSGGGIRSATFP